LVRNLDEAIKEVKLLGEHEEESIQKITELEALCKKLREDAQRLEEEKATLEGMVESRDELLMEIARETRLDRMGEDAEDEEEDEDVDNGEDTAAPHAPTPPTAAPEEIDDEVPVKMIPEQEALVPHEVMLADADPEMPQPRLYHRLKMDYVESPPRMMEDFDCSYAPCCRT
jgi:predicted nuclease with TOPRIM domain